MSNEKHYKIQRVLMINRSSRDSRKDVKIDLSKSNLIKRELIGLMFNLLALA